MLMRSWGALLFLLIFSAGIKAQGLVVLTDADLKKEVAKAHQFSYENASQVFQLKHRFSRLGEMTVALASPRQLSNGNFSLKETLPATLTSGESLSLSFSADYSRSIRLPQNVDLIVYPTGDKDPAERGVKVKLILSAEGRPMFWNERARKYTVDLPAYEFNGSGDKLIELTWNGSGSGSCTFTKSDDQRGAFYLVPNTPGASGIPQGTTIPLGSGGRSYFVRYDAAGNRVGSSDRGRITFSEKSGKSLSVDLYGTYKGGPSLFTMLKNSKGKNNQVGGPDPAGGNNITDIINAGNSRNFGGNEGSVGDTSNNPYGWKPLNVAEREAKTATWPSASINRNTGDPIVRSGNNTATNNSNNSRPVTPRNTGNNSTAGNVTPRAAADPGRVYTLDEAQNMLQGIFDRKKNENLFIKDEAAFLEDEEDSKYKTALEIQLDSLREDPNFNIDIHWVKAVTGEDSLDLPMTNVSYEADSSILRVILPDEIIHMVRKQDSFVLLAGFMPEYMAGNTPINLLDQNQVFVGRTIARVNYQSNWMLWLWILLAAFFVLIFVMGWFWVRNPIKSFRYLRESRYQKDRYRASKEGEKMPTETVFVDLSRHDSDLIQLSFLDKDSAPVVAGQEATVRKFQEIEATVTAPNRRGLRRFFTWFYGIFGMSKEPRFRSVYYSLRIENIPNSIPKHLRLKDEGGLLLIGTNLTGNVLATDHQDFRFTKRPFTFRLYLDPAEILDYSTTSPSVSLPFRVIEEPFEGYVITREFSLEMKITSKY